jgi:hypothetical protein
MPSPFRKATVVALCAAAIGGIGLTTPAQAAQLGFVRVDVDEAQGRDVDWTRQWSTGWDACRAAYPATKSIRLNWTGGIAPDNIYTLWTCFDNS